MVAFGLKLCYVIYVWPLISKCVRPLVYHPKLRDVILGCSLLSLNMKVEMVQKVSLPNIFRPYQCDHYVR